jgi:hypothetical protein
MRRRDRRVRRSGQGRFRRQQAVKQPAGAIQGWIAREPIAQAIDSGNGDVDRASD